MKWMIYKHTLIVDCDSNGNAILVKIAKRPHCNTAGCYHWKYLDD